MKLRDYLGFGVDGFAVMFSFKVIGPEAAQSDIGLYESSDRERAVAIVRDREGVESTPETVDVERVSPSSLTIEELKFEPQTIE